MARQRRNNFVLEVEGPQTAAATEKTGNPKIQEVRTVNFDSVKKTYIDNPQQGASSNGTLAPIVGLYDSISVPIETNVEGLRSVAAYSASVEQTAFSHLLSAVAQFSGTCHARSKVTAYVPGTSFSEDYHSAHRPGTTNLTGKTPIGLALVSDDTATSFDVVAFTSGSAAAPFVLNNFLMESDFALEANDIVYASINHQFVESWSTAVNPYMVTVRGLGNDQKQNHKLIGAVGSLSIGAIAPKDVPVASFTFVSATGDKNFADTRPSTSPVKPKIFAGSQLRLAKTTETEGVAVCGRVELKLGTEFIREECPESSIAVAQMLRGTGASAEVKLTIHHDVTPDTYGSSSDSWESSLEDGTEFYHLKAVYGQLNPGSTFAVYLPELVLVAIDEGEEDGWDIRTLTFRPKQDSQYPAWCTMLA